MSQWINKFHTQTINEYFIESSNGVTELNWTPPEVQAFQKYADEKLKGIDLEILATRNPSIAMNMKLRSKSVVKDTATSFAKTQG